MLTSRARRISLYASAFLIGVALTATATSVNAQAASTPQLTPATVSVLEAINTIGILRFPGTYLTVTATGPHAITVEDTAHNTALSAAIKTVKGIGAYTLTERRVARSFAALDALTKKMAQDSDSLASTGVDMAQWGPDFGNDNVSVILKKPAGTKIASLSGAAVASASSTLASRYGQGLISVSATTQQVARPIGGAGSARDVDSNPVNAGDQYSSSSSSCTTGFNVENPATKRYYILSAGHCGIPGDLTTAGTVKAQYYNNDGWDFETIQGSAGTAGDVEADVWTGAYGTTSVYKVLGQEVPLVNVSQVTDDGDVSSPERTGNLVKAYDICTSEEVTLDLDFNICNEGEDQSPNGANICAKGDSGGPVYNRTSPLGGAYAVGILNMAGPTVPSPICYFQDINAALREAGGYILVTSPALQTAKLNIGGTVLCMDVDHSGYTPLTAVDVYSCNGGAAQQWTVEPGTTQPGGTVQALGQCLDVYHSGTANGTPVDMYTCNGGGAQQWVYNANTKAFVNPESNKCLDDPHSSTTHGTQLDIYSCNGGNAQTWTLN